MASDRRVKYTKMVLRESLIKLLRDKSISRISIKEICEEADINRTTFYTHYSDQFDLLKNIEEDFISDINSYLDNFTIEDGEPGQMQILSRIFECIQQNIELCRVLLGENGDMDFLTNILQVISERIVFEWHKKKAMDETTAQYIYTFIANGSVGVIRKWLFDTAPKTPHEMAGFLLKLANKGLEAFVKI